MTVPLKLNAWPTFPEPRTAMRVPWLVPTISCAWPSAVHQLTMLGGMLAQLTGGCVSCTVTVNAQVLVLPLASTAVQLTGVVPVANVDPEGGVQLIETPGQLSVTVAANVTLLFEH